MSRRWIALCGVVALAACGGDAQEDSQAATEQAARPERSAEQMLDRLRQETAKYADVAVAEADGYMMDPHGLCVDASMVGAPAEAGNMGIHWVNLGLLGTPNPPDMTRRLDGTDGEIQWARPEVLVYEPQADGSMQLVAAEYLVFKAAWDAANAEPPSFQGTPFIVMADDPATEMDEAHGFEPHYELHVWVHRDNPTGMFAEFNPAVTCQHAAPPTQM